MKGRYLFALTIAVLVLSAAPTVVIADWSEDFEAYNAGDVIQGKGDFIYWANTTDVDSHALVSDAVAYEGTKSLMLGGHAGAHYSDPVLQFANTTTGVSSVNTGQWVQSQMVYVPASSIQANGAYVDFNYMSNHPDPLDWGGGHPRFNLETGKVEGTGVTDDISIITDQWVEFRMEVDFDTTPSATAKYYYDGTLISTYDWDDDPVQLAAIDYWAPAAAGAVYVDNISLVPEPASLATLALGGLAVLRRKRTR